MTIEQQPASEQMRDLMGTLAQMARQIASHADEKAGLDLQGPLEQAFETLTSPIEALYARMQAEGQATAEQRALLARFAAGRPHADGSLYLALSATDLAQLIEAARALLAKDGKEPVP